MSDTKRIILHNYARSPFSEKIRLALALKNLSWTSVEVPTIMPKPDLMPLTGGYRRTPVMQIGADIYCDTAVILQELETRYKVPTLKLPGHEGIASMIGAWADRVWFQTSVGVIFGTMGDAVPKEFIDDRSKMMGRPFDTEAMKAAVPMLKDQWRAHLMMIEERLAGGRGAGAGAWLIGMKPGLADVHAHMNIWFVLNAVPDFVNSCFGSAPLTEDWYKRLSEIKGQSPELLSAEAALELAHAAAPHLKPATVDDNEPQELEAGEQLSIAPDDYAKDWVTGKLVHSDARRIVLERVDPKAGTLHLHFPRAGYVITRN